MKKIIILILMILLPNVILADDCNYKLLNKHKNKLKNVEISYVLKNYGEGINIYQIKVLNVPSGFIVEFDDDEDGALIASEPIVMSGDTILNEGSKNVKVEIYPGFDDYCYGKNIYRKNVRLDYFNHQSQRKECKKYKDFKYCRTNYSKVVSDKEFNDELSNYVKEIKVTKKEVINKKTNIINVIVAIAVSLFLGGILISMIYKYIKKEKYKISLPKMLLIIMLLLSFNFVKAEPDGSSPSAAECNTDFCGDAIGWRLSVVKAEKNLAGKTRGEKLYGLKRVGYIRDFLRHRYNFLTNAKVITPMTRIDHLKRGVLSSYPSDEDRVNNNYAFGNLTGKYKLVDKNNLSQYIRNPYYGDMVINSGLTCLFGHLDDCNNRWSLITKKKSGIIGAKDYETCYPSLGGKKCDNHKMDYFANYAGISNSKTRQLFYDTLKKLSYQEFNNLFGIKGADMINDSNVADYYIQMETIVYIRHDGEKCYGNLFDTQYVGASSNAPYQYYQKVCRGYGPGTEQNSYEYVGRDEDENGAGYALLLYQGVAHSAAAKYDKHHLIPWSKNGESLFKDLSSSSSSSDLSWALTKLRLWGKSGKDARFSSIGVALFPASEIRGGECPKGTSNEARKNQEEYCNNKIYSSGKAPTQKLKEECLNKCGWVVSKPTAQNNNAKCTFNLAKGAGVKSPTGEYDQTLRGYQNTTRVFNIGQSDMPFYVKEYCENYERVSFDPTIEKHSFTTNLEVTGFKKCKYFIDDFRDYIEFKIASIPRKGKFKCSDNYYCKTLKSFNAGKLASSFKYDMSAYKAKVTGKIDYLNNQTGSFNYNLEKYNMFNRKNTYKQNIQTPIIKDGKNIHYLFKEIAEIGPNAKEIELNASAYTTLYTPKFYIDYRNKHVKNKGNKFEESHVYYTEDEISSLDLKLNLNGFLCDNSDEKFSVSNICKIKISGVACYSDDLGSKVYSRKSTQNFFGVDTSRGLRIKDSVISKNPINKFDGTTIIKEDTNSVGAVVKSTTSNNNDNQKGCGAYFTRDDDCEATPVCTINPKGGSNFVKIYGKSYDKTKHQLFIKKGMPFTPTELKYLHYYKGYYVDSNNIDKIYTPYDDSNSLNGTYLDNLSRRDAYYGAVCLDKDCKIVKPCYNPKVKTNCFAQIKARYRSNYNTVLQSSYSGNYLTEFQDVAAYCKANAKVEEDTDGTYEACVSKCYVVPRSNEYVYRSIKYNEPFNNRKPGSNWIARSKIISDSKEYVKKHKPIYSANLNNDVIKNIRKDNAFYVKEKIFKPNGTPDVYSDMLPLNSVFTPNKYGYKSMFIHSGRYAFIFNKINDKPYK